MGKKSPADVTAGVRDHPAVECVGRACGMAGVAPGQNGSGACGGLVAATDALAFAIRSIGGCP
jgi:hypothetical protein